MLREIIVSNPQQEILLSTEDRNLFLAGIGSGKSHMAGLLSSDFIINYPFVRGFIGANTYGQLSKSTLDRIFKVWQTTFGWINGVEYVVDKIPPAHFTMIGPKLKSYENTISFNNGCLIFTASLDNYKVIDGTEFGWAILDETKDTKEEAVKETIITRLRQPGLWVGIDGRLYDKEPDIECKSWNPLYVLTSPAKVDWINEWFGLSDKYDAISKQIFSKTDYFTLREKGKLAVISSTYHNEHNLPKDFISGLLNDYAGSPHLVDMLIYGSPIAKSGGEFFSGFERLKHVGKVDYLPGVSIHLSFDFNRVPYNTATIWQIIYKDGAYQVRGIDEICLPNPRNTTEDVCNEFISRYCEGKKIANVFLYGDATGTARKSNSREHDWETIERVLKKYITDESMRVPKGNPLVDKTRAFCNKALAGALPIQIIISDKMKNTIADLEFLKEGPDGGMLKQMATDPVSNARYEKYGHTSSTMRYLLCSAFNGMFEGD